MQKITATRTQWHHIIIIICIGISTAFYIGKVPPALPFIRSELEMDLVTVTGVWETAAVLLFALTLINITIAIAIRYLELA